MPTETIQAPKKELTTGSIFAGSYQIMTELGKGGMGRVYRALDQKINEEVAIKLIKPEIAKDKKPSNSTQTMQKSIFHMP